VFTSDVTITPRVRLDPSDPFSTLFTVTNEGAFPIENVAFACHLNYVEIRNYKIATRDQDALVDPNREPEIKGRKSQDVVCIFGVLGGVRIITPPNGPAPDYHAADITLTVSYRPYFWKRTIQSQRFVALTDGHGKIVEWAHQAD
jgi:hypothetical protein